MKMILEQIRNVGILCKQMSSDIKHDFVTGMYSSINT